jgi:choline dehydrogenase-like flavoprotein
MGLDPGTSVVTPDLQVHDIEGLFVADASVLPTAGAVNTGLTIVALALRLGDHIAGNDRAAAGRAANGREAQDAPGAGAPLTLVETAPVAPSP